MNQIQDFTRQSFLGEDSAAVLANARVAVVGVGGGGSHLAQQLAHLGIGEVRVIDPDCIEASNLNRLVGASQKDVEEARPKVEIARRTMSSIRPGMKVQVRQSTWQEAADYIRDAHIVVGCVDGFQQRDYLEGAARRYLLPYVDIGMSVTAIGKKKYAVAGQLIVTRPGGPCMRCLGFLTPARLVEEENRYGDAGVIPQVVWTNGTLASLAVGAVVQMLTPWADFERTYTWLELDGNAQTVCQSTQPSYLPPFHGCPHRGGPDGLGDPFFSFI